VRRPMRCIIICSTRCPAPTPGSTTDGQRVSAFALSYAIGAIGHESAPMAALPGEGPFAAPGQPLIMRKRMRSLRTK
jgi:hypothetical protein